MLNSKGIRFANLRAQKTYSIVKENIFSHKHDENLSWKQSFNLYANVTISREESVVDPHRETWKVIDSRVFPRFHLRHFYAVTLAERERESDTNPLLSDAGRINSRFFKSIRLNPSNNNCYINQCSSKQFLLFRRRLSKTIHISCCFSHVKLSPLPTQKKTKQMN